MKKPVSEPATEEEEARVKSLLAKSGMPYDRVKHRATYEFTLSMIRTVRIVQFRISPADASAEYKQTKECLQELGPVEFSET